jgi:hypothetical protein
VTALAGALMCVAGTPAALGANAVGNPVLADCNSHGVITHNFTLKELHHAQAIMPASYKEYGDCPDAILTAIDKVRAGKQIAPSSGSGGSFLPTPVIVILVVLILVALTFGALAVRRRRTGREAAPDGDDRPGTPSPPVPPPPGDGDPPREPPSPPAPPPPPPAE